MINKSAGFTLLELMVVIAIIGLLSAVVFGSLSESKDNAREVTALKEVRKISEAMFMFELDTTVRINCPAGSNCTNSLINNPGVSGWDGPYLSTGPIHPWEGEIGVGNNFIFLAPTVCSLMARICADSNHATWIRIGGRCVAFCPEDPPSAISENQTLIYLTNDRPGFGRSDNRAKIPTASMLRIDRALDDGNLNTGLIIQVNTGREADSGQLIIKPNI